MNSRKNDNDYPTGGMLMPGRTFSSDNYRFGYNGKLKDDEVYGSGNWYDYGMRCYDARLVRFPSVDPLTSKFPMLTPYQYASNNPIMNIDLDGLEGTPAQEQKDGTVTTAVSSTYTASPVSMETNSIDRSKIGTISPSNNSQFNVGPSNGGGSNQAAGQRAQLQSNISDLQNMYPTSYGSPQTGLGLVPCLYEGAMQGTYLAAPEAILSKGGGLAANGLGKAFPSSSIGRAISTFEGIPSLNLSLNKSVLKYASSGDDFTPFSRNLSFTTNFVSHNSVDVYSKLGLGFQTSKGSINSMSTSYTIFQTNMKGLYLSGRIAAQPASIGGEIQQVGIKGMTGFSKTPSTILGKTGFGF